MASQPPRQIKTIIGSNIAAARDAKKWTQRELARKVDVDTLAVSRWERGVVRPSDTNLQAVAEAFGRDLVWFFHDREPLKDAA